MFPVSASQTMVKFLFQTISEIQYFFIKLLFPETSLKGS